MNKKIIYTLTFIALLIPGTAFAVLSSVDRIINHIEPLIKTDFIKGLYFVASSTSQASVFPIANIPRLENLTVNGFVKTINTDGTLDIDTTTYAPIADLANYVPYTGATADVDIDTHTMSATNYRVYNNGSTVYYTDTGVTAKGNTTFTGTGIFGLEQGTKQANLDFSGITGNKNYTFPDVTGTFVLGTGVTSECAVWASTNTLGSSACPSGGGSQSPFATTTSTVAGRAIVYPLNNTDILTVGGNSTTTAKMYFDPNVQQSQLLTDLYLGNSLSPQLDAFGTKNYEFQILESQNDVVGATIYNRSAGSLAASGIFFQNNKSSIGGIGATQTYYGGCIYGGGNWNGVPIGFGALGASDFGCYNSDGNMIIAAASSTPSGSTTVGNINFFTGTGSFAGGIPDVTISYLGNLGIGTTSPYSKLSVVGRVAAEFYDATSTTATSTLNGQLHVGRFVSGTGNLDSKLTLQAADATTARYILNYKSSTGQSLMSIRNDGSWVSGTSLNFNTGAGVNSSSSGGAVTLATGGSSSGNITITTGTSGIRRDITFLPNNSATGGNVGVATTTPYAKFSVAGANTASTTMAVTHVANGTAPVLVVATTTGTATSTAFIIDSIGQVGIGTSTPWRSLSVNGGVAFQGLTSSTAGNAVCILTNFEIVNAGGTTCVTSSARFKTDIKDLKNGLSTVMLLKPREFTRKNPTPSQPSGKEIGFIAEEIEKVEPRLVEYEADGKTPRGVNYAESVALLTKAIQEQQAQIQALKEEVKLLKLKK